MERKRIIEEADIELKKAFGEVVGETVYFSVAPGRANLIGEHTDYNEGFVMPLAINKYIAIAGFPNKTDKIIVKSAYFNELKQFNVNDIAYKVEDGWSNYLKGIIYFLKMQGYEISGATLVIVNNLPINAGVSSSAALSVAFSNLLNKMFELNLNERKIAEVSYRAEREFVGVSCGIMDQYVISLARENTTFFLDTRNKQYEYVKFPSDKVTVVLLDTKVKHEARQILNQRRTECNEAVKIIKKYKKDVMALRDLTIDDFLEYKKYLPDPLQKRVEHVVYENERVIKAKRELERGNIQVVGEILKEGHISCKNLYEVSSKELDILVDLAYSIDGVIGARMTGAGLGGNTINLVYNDAVNHFIETIKAKYKEKIGFEPGVIVTSAVSGVT